jgi:hypothetical protein
MDLEELERLLRGIEPLALRPANVEVLDVAIKRMKNVTPREPEDGQTKAAVHRFWSSGQLLSFRDLWLTSNGLLHPIQDEGSTLLASPRHVNVLLGEFGKLVHSPRKLHLCYWGLIHTYFNIDPKEKGQVPEVLENWTRLRSYLKDNLSLLQESPSDPEWLILLREHDNLFEEDPCAAYAEAVLEGDSSVVEELEDVLKISAFSWFRGKLLWAQVEYLIDAEHDYFIDRIPLLLERIAGNRVHRDALFAVILDRYAEVPGRPLVASLREKAVEWWGNPWLPSNQPNWLRVSESTKRMVTTWLNTEFITAFFNKLAKDGLGDANRSSFWLKYASVMSSVHFGLTEQTYRSRDRDMVLLRNKLAGLYTMFDGSGANNAFIMSIGPLVIVEFGEEGAIYGYDSRINLPFDIKYRLREKVNSSNSLKHESSSRVLYKRHAPRDTWALDLARELKVRFGIAPEQPDSTSTGRAEGPASSQGSYIAKAVVPIVANETGSPAENRKDFSKAALTQLAKRHGLLVVDESGRNGHIWVRPHNANAVVESTLKAWGFNYKSNKGWWR